MRIILPKSWSRARRKSARAIIRYDVASLLAFDRRTSAQWLIQSEGYERFQQEITEMFLAVARG